MTYPLVSADSHIIEPPDLWTKRIDKKYRDQAPRIVQDAEGAKFMTGKEAGGFFGGTHAANTKPKTTRSRIEDVPKGAWDPDARVKDMEVDGVVAEVLYCTLAMRIFGYNNDPEYQAACFRAYNDWLGEYCSAHPNQLIGVALISTVDIEEATNELKRAASLGLKGAAVSAYKSDDKNYGLPMYDPFWREAEHLGIPVSLHSYTGGQPMVALNFLVDYSLAPHHMQRSLAFITLGGVFERFPKLRVVSAENDAGWAGHLLERMDWAHERKGIRWGQPLKSLPSEQARSHVSYTFMRDAASVLTRDLVGVGNLMWCSDYPHDDCTWPDSREVVARQFKDISEGDRVKITCLNAARLYGIPVSQTN